MANVFSPEEVATIKAWISGGAMIPAGEPDGTRVLAVAATGSGDVHTPTDSEDPEDGSFGKKRWRIGMGSVH